MTFYARVPCMLFDIPFMYILNGYIPLLYAPHGICFITLCNLLAAFNQMDKIHFLRSKIAFISIKFNYLQVREAEKTLKTFREIYWLPSIHDRTYLQ